MNPDDFPDDIMSNAPASDCGTLLRLSSADDVFAATMMSSAKASGHMATNCIAPDLCEKLLLQFLRWLWTSFSSHKTNKISR